VLSALLESALVHHLIRGKREIMALLLDQIFRVLLPCVMYPVCVISLILGAYYHDETTIRAGLAVGVCVPLLGGLLRAAQNGWRFDAEKKRLAKALVEADEEQINDKSDSPLLRQAFDHFDLDKSHDIDHKEVRSLMTAMFPFVPKEHRKAMIKLQVGDDGAPVRFEDFDDTVLAWRHYAATNDPDGSWRTLKVELVIPRGSFVLRQMGKIGSPFEKVSVDAPAAPAPVGESRAHAGHRDHDAGAEEAHAQNV